MTYVSLPPFVDQLLEDTGDPSKTPAVSPCDTGGWVQPIAEGLLRYIGEGTPGAPSDPYLVRGSAYLPLPASDGHPLCLRVAFGTGWLFWPVDIASVVLPIAGQLELEVYDRALLQPNDAHRSRLLRTRKFAPGKAFSMHGDASCCIWDTYDNMQLLVLRQPDSIPRDRLTLNERAVLSHRARAALRPVVDGRAD